MLLKLILSSKILYISLRYSLDPNSNKTVYKYSERRGIIVQYHEVRLYVEFNDISSLVVWSGSAAPSMSNISFEDCGVLVEYIYLDSEERRRFAQVGHEYLIEQVQFPGQANLNSGGASSSANSQKFKMDFNHPCKEVVFALQAGAFNGQAIKSSLLGSRGRFLTYSNKADENSWDSAVDYAARNLANGMVVAKTTSPGSNWTQIVLTNNTSIGIGSTGSVTQVVGSTTWNFIISNNGGAAITVEELPIWVLNDGGLTKNGQGLANSVQEVTVAITVTAVNAGAMTTIDNSFGTDILASTSAQYLPSDSLVVSNHTLNLTDVSVPVEDFVDTRAHKLLSAAINPWDVSVVQPSNYGLRLDGAGNPVSSGNITLNGHDRFSVQDGDYFNYYQPLQHHTRTPADGINVYSFALHPEQHQPSGTCNMSRIDSAYLVLKFMDRLRENSTIKLDYTQDSLFYIFALNFNVLRIMSGINSKKGDINILFPPVPNSQMLIKLVEKTLLGKHYNIDHVMTLLNSIILYNWLVNAIMHLQQDQTAGTPLQLQTTTSINKFFEGTRLIAETNGNNVWRLGNPQSSFYIRKLEYRRRFRDCMVLGLLKISNFQ